jgi:hypothetical protein
VANLEADSETSPEQAGISPLCPPNLCDKFLYVFKAAPPGPLAPPTRRTASACFATATAAQTPVGLARKRENPGDRH